jgi:hypothetical protein
MIAYYSDKSGPSGRVNDVETTAIHYQIEPLVLLRISADRNLTLTPSFLASSAALRMAVINNLLIYCLRWAIKLGV